MLELAPEFVQNVDMIEDCLQDCDSNKDNFSEEKKVFLIL